VDLWATSLVALITVAAAGGLLVWHRRVWQRAQGPAIEPAERDYRWRQYRRRMQTSAMLGLLGLAVLAGRLMMLLHISPTLHLIYWGAVVLLLLWIALLALVDAWATQFHYGRIRDRFAVEEVRLKAELRRLKTAAGNGRSDRSGLSPPEDSPHPPESSN